MTHFLLHNFIEECEIVGFMSNCLVSDFLPVIYIYNGVWASLLMIV